MMHLTLKTAKRKLFAVFRKLTTNELFAGQPQPAAPSNPLIALAELLDLCPI